MNNNGDDLTWMEDSEGLPLGYGPPVEGPSFFTCLTVVSVFLFIVSAILLCGWLWLQGV